MSPFPGNSLQPCILGEHLHVVLLDASDIYSDRMDPLLPAGLTFALRIFEPNSGAQLGMVSPAHHGVIYEIK